MNNFSAFNPPMENQIVQVQPLNLPQPPNAETDNCTIDDQNDDPEALAEKAGRAFDAFGERLNTALKSIYRRLANLENSGARFTGPDEEKSAANRFIDFYLDELNWPQIMEFFEKVVTEINQIPGIRPIPLFSREEKRKKKLFLHHLNLFWDDIDRSLDNLTTQRIKNSILNPGASQQN